MYIIIYVCVPCVSQGVDVTICQRKTTSTRLIKHINSHTHTRQHVRVYTHMNTGRAIVPTPYSRSFLCPARMSYILPTCWPMSTGASAEVGKGMCVCICVRACARGFVRMCGGGGECSLDEMKVSIPGDSLTQACACPPTCTHAQFDARAR